VAVASNTNKTFTVSNAGGLNATALGETGLTGNFSMPGGYPGTGGDCGDPILPAPGGDCTIVVRFNPSTAGDYASFIKLDYHNGDSTVDVQRPVKGATYADLVINSGPTYDFGTRPTFTSADKTFVVQNLGGVTATTLAGAGLATAEFIWKGGGSYPGAGGDCGTTIAISPGGDCTVTVTYTATANGDYTDTLQLNYWDGASNVSSTRPIEGDTIAILTISDGATYDYGSVYVGSNEDKTFTVTNSGYADATSVSPAAFSLPVDYAWKGGTYPGTGGNCPNGGTIAQGAPACNTVLVFAPTTGGARNSTYQLNFNNGYGAVNTQRAVTGTGEDPAVLVISDGPTYDFGIVNLSSTNDKTFNITNTGSVNATAVGGAAFSLGDYTFLGGTFPGTGGTCPDGGEHCAHSWRRLYCSGPIHSSYQWYTQ